MQTKNRLFTLTLLLTIGLGIQAQAQGRSNVGDTLKKTKNANLKKPVRAKKVWVSGGSCHMRKTTHNRAESYMAKCKPNASRNANAIVNCGGTQAKTVWAQVGRFRVKVPKAKRFECYLNTNSKRYRLGYGAGQTGLLTGNVAAEFTCGCYTPPGGNTCDAQGCRGQMQASMMPKPQTTQLAALMGRLGWHAWATRTLLMGSSKWASLTTLQNAIGG